MLFRIVHKTDSVTLLAKEGCRKCHGRGYVGVLKGGSAIPCRCLSRKVE